MNQESSPTKHPIVVLFVAASPNPRVRKKQALAEFRNLAKEVSLER